MEVLKTIKQGSDVIRFVFLKDDLRAKKMDW